MKIWQLAWLEWFRSNLHGKPNRDFFWLTILLFLTLILALLLSGGREGILNKFLDVSVGYIEGAGIPIWLSTHYSNLSGIDRALSKSLKQQNMKFYPYREVECQNMNLPQQGCGNTSEIWNATKMSSEDEQVPFNGWAVSFDDPLWSISQQNQETSNLPLSIILNKSLFEQYFNCTAYVEILQKQQLPFPLPQKTSKPLYCLADNTLWLEVNVGKKNELVPFQIEWQAHIPTMQKIAFLFPLSTLNTLKMAKRHTITYYPKQKCKTNSRVKSLIIWQAQEQLSEERMNQLMACLQNPERKRSRLSLKPALPKSWVEACAKQSNLPISDKRHSLPYIQITDEETQKYQFKYDADDYLTLSCQEKSACKEIFAKLSTGLGNKVRYNEEGTSATIDMIDANGGYGKAFAYVTNRIALSTQVDQLKNFQTPKQGKAFYIPSTYEDALVRFRFIDKIMDILQWALSLFFILFLIILLLVQVGIVINHRKRNYGILLSKGVSQWQVQGIVLMQMTISFIVAIFFAVLISWYMQYHLANELQIVTTTKPYIDHIIAGQLELLPLSFWDYALIGGVVLGVLYIITELLLWFMILRRNREPAYLFS